MNKGKKIGEESLLRFEREIYGESSAERPDIRHYRFRQNMRHCDNYACAHEESENDG